MMTLAQMCAEALRRDPAQPAIEFAGEWVSWGQLGQLADQLYALIASSGIAAAACAWFTAFSPRRRSRVSLLR
jgi:hypothetical protein